MTSKGSLISISIAMGLGLGAMGHAAAQSYPTRLVTFVNPLAAGGSIDVLCRLTAEKLRPLLGHQIIVENRPGAGGNIAGEFVARAAPDGHTLLCGPDSGFIGHLLHPRLSYDPRAFEPVSVIAAFPMVLVARADLPANNLKELVAYARAHPGKLNYASQGLGQFAHLALEGLKMMANVDIVHVPYRGGGPALSALLAGQVDIFTAPLLTSMPHIKAGKLKLLGVTSRSRIAALPDVPALTETVPGLVADTWVALAAPAGTPKDITVKLSDAVSQALAKPDVRARLSELQVVPLASSPDAMRELVRQAIEQWGRVIAVAKISVD